MNAKKILTTFALTFALFGCANNFQQAVQLTPSALPTKLLMSVKDIKVTDSRQSQALALINNTEFMQVKNIASQIKPWLANSLSTNPSGRNLLKFDVTNAATYIKQYAMTFESEAVLEWQVTIDSGKRTWTKSYQTGINETGPMKFSQEDVTKNINSMLTTLLERTLNDDEFQKALSR